MIPQPTHPPRFKNTHQCDTHSRTHTRTQTHTYDTQDARCLLVERERVNCHHPTVTPEKKPQFPKSVRKNQPQLSDFCYFFRNMKNIQFNVKKT